LTCAFLVFTQKIKKSETNEKTNQISIPSYVSGVVPHHLLADSIIENFFQELEKVESIEQIVLLSPDHFNQFSLYGNQPISDRIALKEDHGITNILSYLEKYFPNAKVSSFLIPAKFSLEDAKIFTEKLNNSLPSSSFILASVDFSHYLPKNIADFHDEKSIRVLLNFEEQQFSNIEVDCPQCLYIVRYFAKIKEKEKPFIIAHKNSQDFSSDKNLQSTTSYFSVLFGGKDNSRGATINENYDAKTFIFTGDLMFDRGIENQIKKNSVFYPFKEIENVLRGVDYVIGNLEGPIINNPIDYGKTSLTFNFDKSIISGLKFGHFNLLSLANNHSLNAGETGLKETKEILKEVGINYFGDPINCDEKDIFSGEDFILVGINQTFPSNCSEKNLEELIKNLKNKNLEKLLFIFIHWGEEYSQIANDFQKSLAHHLIDSGADLIIGSHPHVIQEIEKYNNKYIVYSLGNFIFDQNFSKETSEGLILKVAIKDKKISEIEPIKIGFTKTYQPYRILEVIP